MFDPIDRRRSIGDRAAPQGVTPEVLSAGTAGVHPATTWNVDAIRRDFQSSPNGCMAGR